MNIPIAKPKLEKEEKNQLFDAIKNGWISSRGKYVENFENQIKKILNTKYVVACSNGSVALIMALKALDIRVDDEVIVPDLSFAATINSVINVGAKPVICEVNQDTWCIDTNKIEEKITKRTKAIIPVHLYGNSCNMSKLLQIRKKHNLSIIEDAAEAIGSKYKNKYMGTIGNIGCFSFFANKTITTGEGGCCVTNSKLIYNKLKLYRNNGLNDKKKYYSKLPGYNFKITNLQAAIGSAQIKKLKKFSKIRNNISKCYEKYLHSIKYQKQISAQDVKKVEWLFTIIIKKINIKKLINFLASNNIETRNVFYPFHKQKIYEKYVPKNFDDKNSNIIFKYGITLPTYVGLDKKKIKKIVKKIIEFIN